jgi:hypothetical protein
MLHDGLVLDTAHKAKLLKKLELERERIEREEYEIKEGQVIIHFFVIILAWLPAVPRCPVFVEW